MSENIQHKDFDKLFEDKVRHAVSLAERDHIKSFINDLESDYQSSQSKPRVGVRPLYNKKWLLMAASLLLLAVAMFTFRSVSDSASTPAEIAEQWFEPYGNGYRPITRGQTNGADAEMSALIKYEAEDYAEALTLLNALPDQNDFIRMFKGVSAMQLNKLSDAKAEFQHIIKSNSIHKRAAQWYMGLILLKEGFIDRAKEYFEVLANQPQDSSYQKDASEVLWAL